MKRRNTFWVHLLLVLACLLVTAPILYALLKATQTRAQVLSPSLVPGTELWANVRAAWTGGNLGVYMRNSLIVAVAAGALIFKVGFAILGGMAQPIPEPPPAGELRKVKIEYRCTICGTELRMTVAKDEMPF